MSKKGGVPENLKPRKKGDPALPGAGRPRKIPSLDKLLAEEFGDDKKGMGDARRLIQTLKRGALSGKLNVTRLQTAERLADRIWGKAKSNDTLNLKIPAVEEILADEKAKAALVKYGLQVRGSQKKETSGEA